MGWMFGKKPMAPADPGVSGWSAMLEPEPPRAPVSDDVACDWLVIGAGFAGLAAARELTRLCPGAKIVVLEARRVAEGPAGRNSGFMIDAPHELASSNYAGDLDRDRFAVKAFGAAIDFAMEMAREFGMPESAISRSGKINAAATRRGLRLNEQYAAHLGELGKPSEILGAERMREITGSSHYLGGLLTPGCAILQPALFIRSAARGLERAGVRIHEKSPVIKLIPGRHWTAVAPGGRVTAPKAILAVNGGVERFGFFRRRLMHVFTYASLTRPLTGGESRELGGDPVWGLTPADPLGSSVRKISDRGRTRILVRNRFTYDPSMEVPAGRLGRMARFHDRSFAARFPKLAGIEMEFRWGGRLCLSRNNVWAFGEVEPNLYSACCQNGIGTTKGTLSGMLAARLAAGAECPLVDAVLGEAAPSRLPPEPIPLIGANLLIRLKEIMSGREL